MPRPNAAARIVDSKPFTVVAERIVILRRALDDLEVELALESEPSGEHST